MCQKQVNLKVMVHRRKSDYHQSATRFVQRHSTPNTSDQFNQGYVKVSYINIQKRYTNSGININWNKCRQNHCNLCCQEMTCLTLWDISRCSPAQAYLSHILAILLIVASLQPAIVHLI